MEEADFVAVGGGVYGATIAYELVLSGSSVTPPEAEHLASHASGGPGKRAIRANGRNLSMAREASEKWSTLASEPGIEEVSIPPHPGLLNAFGLARARS